MQQIVRAKFSAVETARCGRLIIYQGSMHELDKDVLTVIDIILCTSLINFYLPTFFYV